MTMPSNTPKYIFENGVMKINPAYGAEQAKQGSPTTVATPDKALAIVSSTQDIIEATQIQQQAIGQPMQLSESTTASMTIMQDKYFLDKFNAPQQIDGGQVLDGLSTFFSKYEVPIGLINKLLALQEFNTLNFIIDDSSSMGTLSDFTLGEATLYLHQKYNPDGRQQPKKRLTRWNELEDRIHILVDILAYIPTSITIGFLNRNNVLVLDHCNKTPEQFSQEAHQKVSQIFSYGPNGSTPIYKKLSAAFNQSSGKVMHYLFTDGEPDGSVAEVERLIINRPQPEMNPLTFISCSEDEHATAWMKKVDEKALFTAELDDFNSERKEVLQDQGPGFPYSKGVWLLCQLVAAINKIDLDKIDESIPFTKQTMDNLLGRKLSLQEYQHYFYNNPNIKKHINHDSKLPTFESLFNDFASEKRIADEII